MKVIATILFIMVLMVGCVKPPDTLEQSFWDPETEVNGLGQVLGSSFVLNNENERVYTVRFKVFYDRVPLERDDAILSVAIYNNGVNIPMQFNAANRAEYSAMFFAPPNRTTCLTFGFVTSTGGFTRQFDLFCVDVP